jgi:hypothetical protein
METSKSMDRSIIEKWFNKESYQNAGYLIISEESGTIMVLLAI